jgi:hypothetical protein
MRSLAKIERWEAKYVYTHMRVAYLLCRTYHRHQLAQVAIRAAVVPILVEVHPCLCASSVSLDFLRCNFGNFGNHPFDVREPLPGVFRLQPSPCYARETQHPASSLLRLRREVS